MLRCEDTCLSFPFPKTLVRAAARADYITLFSSKGNGSRVDLHVILFLIFCASEIGGYQQHPV